MSDSYHAGRRVAGVRRTPLCCGKVGEWRTRPLLRRFFAARSILEVPFRPLKLTEQALLSSGKRTGKNLAALASRSVTPPASPGRYLAKTAAIL